MRNQCCTLGLVDINAKAVHQNSRRSALLNKVRAARLRPRIEILLALSDRPTQAGQRVVCQLFIASLDLEQQKPSLVEISLPLFDRIQPVNIFSPRASSQFLSLVFLSLPYRPTAVLTPVLLQLSLFGLPLWLDRILQISLLFASFSLHHGIYRFGATHVVCKMIRPLAFQTRFLPCKTLPESMFSSASCTFLLPTLFTVLLPLYRKNSFWLKFISHGDHCVHVCFPFDVLHSFRLCHRHLF